MPTNSKQEVTQLLRAWHDGDQEALNQLIPLVEAELHRLAEIHLRDERQGHTLQTTALVNEAYIRLIDWQSVEWQNRAQFFAIASKMMRRVLVEHARRRNYQKRGGKNIRLSLSAAENVSAETDPDVLALDEALSELEALDPRRSRIVELKFFGGLEMKEISEVMSVPLRTVYREWESARTWLFMQLSQE
jgi:RNA polymerase sigma factor (TIGR02999 family)